MIKKFRREAPAACAPCSSRWSAGEAIYCFIAGQLSVGAGTVASVGAITSAAEYFPLAGGMFVAASISATACLHLRKERLGNVE
ncbi:hypothetical protein [Streptomyces sp. NPDC002082]|uniref:hypothetical protein n=1 Tax=Streptomyces sp. NPDC002082 TaxID=3154772 RepID=UPI00331D61EE